MKKQMKKLALTRETLTNLQHSSLLRIAGGITAVQDCGTQSCAPPYSSCEFSNGQNTCVTCEGVCTTNYC